MVPCASRMSSAHDLHFPSGTVNDFILETKFSPSRFHTTPHTWHTLVIVGVPFLREPLLCVFVRALHASWCSWLRSISLLRVLGVSAALSMYNDHKRQALLLDAVLDLHTSLYVY